MINFSMNAKVKMNQDVSRSLDTISPGGYEIESNGETFLFDFTECVCTADESDSSVLCIEARGLDYSAFPDLGRITEGTLSGMAKFLDFFVYTGAEYGSAIQPLKLLECTFYLEGGKEVKVPEHVCAESLVACEVKPTGFF